uniref:Chromosome partition protein Smc n=1 Tax=Pseudomonas phage Orisa02 TaxID=3138543 RepID=A0AAU6W2L9_9VIRU
MSNEFKLVPVEPTDEMNKAGMRWMTGFQHMRAGDKRNALNEAFSAMLAAAPQPPALGGELGLKALQFHAKKITANVESAAEKYERGESALGLLEDIAESSLILSSGLEEHRAHLAPLQAENKRLDLMVSQYDHDHDQWDAERKMLKARCDELEKAFRKLRDVARDCEQIASSYSPCIDSVEEHGGDDHEDPSCAIHHRLYYAMFDADAALSKPAGSEQV